MAVLVSAEEQGGVFFLFVCLLFVCASTPVCD